MPEYLKMFDAMTPRELVGNFAPYMKDVFRKRDDVKMFSYEVAGGWKVWETPDWKIVGNSAGDYNYFFSKTDGYTVRFGASVQDDPKWCALGPEILDLEIMTNQCTPVGGHNCRFCYKGNNSGPGRNMSLDMFKNVVGRFPKNLSQIAFGITSLNGNPDFRPIVESCRSDFGIIPNVTTSGADMDDGMCGFLASNMGACAVSCYEADPKLCYSSIERLNAAADAAGRKMPVNMHILFSAQTFDFVMKTLKDIADGRVPGLASVVLLRLKNVGNAARLDPRIPDDMYRKAIDFCFDNKVSFGFDSCGAKTVERILAGSGREEYSKCCESCESSSFSAYVNVDGMYTSCSFVERRPDVINPMNVLGYESFTDLWNSDAVGRVRAATHACGRSCPWYDLDGDGK